MSLRSKYRDFTDLAGQLVTVAAHLVMVTSWVVYTVLSAMTAVAIAAAAKMEKRILILVWLGGVEGGVEGFV